MNRETARINSEISERQSFVSALSSRYRRRFRPELVEELFGRV